MNVIASGSADNTIRLWGLSDGCPMHTIMGHSGTPCTVWQFYSAVFCRSCCWLGVDLIPLRPGYDFFTGTVTTLSFSLNGAQLASGGTDQRSECLPLLCIGLSHPYLFVTHRVFLWSTDGGQALCRCVPYLLYNCMYMFIFNITTSLLQDDGAGPFDVGVALWQRCVYLPNSCSNAGPLAGTNPHIACLCTVCGDVCILLAALVLPGPESDTAGCDSCFNKQS